MSFQGQSHYVTTHLFLLGMMMAGMHICKAVEEKKNGISTAP